MNGQCFKLATGLIARRLMRRQPRKSAAMTRAMLGLPFK